MNLDAFTKDSALVTDSTIACSPNWLLGELYVCKLLVLWSGTAVIRVVNYFCIYISLCVVSQGPAVFETCFVTVLVTSSRVLPQLSFCYVPLTSEWCGGSETSCKKRSEASGFF